jgi:hypothetical protein
MSKVENDQMEQEPEGLIWRSFLNLIAWSTLTACSVLLTTMGAVGLGMILSHFGIPEMTRLKLYVVWYAIASPIAILVAFRWFR